MNKELENREILLTSSAFVKAVSNLSDNVAGKYLMPSIREAQEIKLKGILGHALLEKCKTLVKYNEFKASFNLDFNNDFEWSFGGNENYRKLIDECQYFLAYSAIVEVIYKTSFKLANMGLVKKNPHKFYPMSAYNWPLSSTVWPTMDGTKTTVFGELPEKQPEGYHWYLVGKDLKLKPESVVSLWRGAYVPLDGVVCDNSELGQKYDVYVSVKIEGGDVFSPARRLPTPCTTLTRSWSCARR